MVGEELLRCFFSDLTLLLLAELLFPLLLLAEGETLPEGELFFFEALLLPFFWNHRRERTERFSLVSLERGEEAAVVEETTGD